MLLKTIGPGCGWGVQFNITPVFGHLESERVATYLGNELIKPNQLKPGYVKSFRRIRYSEDFFADCPDDEDDIIPGHQIAIRGGCDKHYRKLMRQKAKVESLSSSITLRDKKPLCWTSGILLDDDLPDGSLYTPEELYRTRPLLSSLTGSDVQVPRLYVHEDGSLDIYQPGIETEGTDWYHLGFDDNCELAKFERFDSSCYQWFEDQEYNIPDIMLDDILRFLSWDGDLGKLLHSVWPSDWWDKFNLCFQDVNNNVFSWDTYGELTAYFSSHSDKWHNRQDAYWYLNAMEETAETHHSTLGLNLLAAVISDDLPF